jgi:hypothetical protein
MLSRGGWVMNEIRSAAIIVLTLFFVGMFWSRYLTRKENSQTLVKWPIFVCVGLGLIIPIQGLLSRHILGDPVNLPSQSPVSVHVLSEGVSNFSEAEMTPAFLARLSSDLEDGVRDRISHHPIWKEKASKLSDLVRAEAGYFPNDMKKLALIKVHVGDNFPIVQIIGEKNRDIVRVICTLDRDASIPLADGPCNDQVRITFGVAMDGVKQDQAKWINSNHE